MFLGFVANIKMFTKRVIRAYSETVEMVEVNRQT
jgi:hypothetical protein